MINTMKKLLALTLILALLLIATKSHGKTRLAKYGVEYILNFELFEIDGVDFRIDAADGGSDCTIRKDQGADNTATNDFVDEGLAYSLTISATEMQAKEVIVYVADSATKVWLDTSFLIQTYGNASAQHAFDLDTASTAQSADNETRLATIETDTNSLNDTKIPQTLNLTASGNIGVDWANVENPTTVLNLSATKVGTSTALGAAAVDDVWDEVLTGATHNIATSSGKRLRQIEAGFVVHSGTAQTGSTGTTIKLATDASATNDIYKGDRVIIVGGTGVGEHDIIISYDGGTKVATLAETWVITPTDDSEYELLPATVDIETWQHNIVTASGGLPDVNIETEDNIDFGATKKASINTEVDNALDTVLPATPTGGSINDILDIQEEGVVTGSAQTGTLSTTEMTTDLTVTVNDQFNGRIITFRKDTSTAALRGQQTDITDTVTTNGKLTFTALTTAPADGDIFEIN